MPKFLTIGYGDRAGYDRTAQALRSAAHEQDARLVAEGAVIGVAGPPVQVRNPEASGVKTVEGRIMSAELPIAERTKPSDVVDVSRYCRESKISRIALLSLVLLEGCGIASPPKPPASELDCMARAMYFESNRSSRDGMIAVGSVVMNRVQSDAFPDTICAVVSQKNQFAPGVMSKEMSSRSAALAKAAAEAVYRGERHPHIAGAQFFHAAWYQASYNNMHYVLTTGGNAFYEKRRPENVTAPTPLPAAEGVTGW